MRAVFLSDLHCGHVAGCTPGCVVNGEGFQPFEWIMQTLDELRPIDACVCLGDAIDGNGARSGGTELSIVDRNEQAKIAAKILMQSMAKKYYMVCGTPYHSGPEECWDKVVGEMVFAEKIADRMKISFQGIIFDLKHKVGTSSVPHGMFTSAAKSGFINSVEAMRGADVGADVFIRAHRHSYSLSKAKGQIHIVLPGLQCGSRFCDRTVDDKPDFGLISVDINDGKMSIDDSRIMTVQTESSPFVTYE